MQYGGTIPVVQVTLQTEQMSFELSMRFLAGADTDEKNSLFGADAGTAFLCSFDIVDKNDFGQTFYFIADTGTDEYPPAQNQYMQESFLGELMLV